VPEVMYAVALLDGKIRPRVAVVKSLASSLCIGSGGSAGREGPIVQIGSAFGSTIGQILKLHPERIKLMVACGAAGGISATFNAPIAGVIFALEVILQQFSIESFGYVVLASVTATAISRSLLGDVVAFRIPPYSLVSFGEFVWYLLLGIITALVAIAYVRVLYWCEDLWERWHRFPEAFKPVTGGLLIGAIGIWFPHIFGVGGISVVGYDTVEEALRGEIAIGLAVILAGLKILATSITLGSGGSGGIFAPSLFIGSMVGCAFGKWVHSMFPDWTAAPGAYALVGMGAIFAGAAHAPMTAIIILFEMTGDYRIILPLMTSVVMSTLISQRLQRESIYTLKISRRGINLRMHPRLDIMDTIRVEDVMTKDFDSVPPDMPIHQLRHEFEETWHHGFPVVDGNGRLHGIVTLTDLSRALTRRDADKLKVADIMTTSVLTCYPDQTLREALRLFGQRDIGRVPVVDRNDPKHIVGLLRRGDVIRGYCRAAMEHAEHLERIDYMKLAHETATEVVELEVTAESPLHGKCVGELTLPRECLLVAIRRNGRTIIPHGDTQLKDGDHVIALATPEVADKLRRGEIR
ncbi:MAG TPA: CBS domain-containing protein, partial [Armatimonadetes bacterium]|nr:CBS domain-containing protein [Armatimonadota bacterium]